MSIDYTELRSIKARGERRAYTDRDVMLYALAVGLGRDPLNVRELPFVFEAQGLRTVPTLASTLGSSAFLKNCGWDFTRVLHTDEHVVLHRPLLEAGTLVLDSDVTDVLDGGENKGAFVCTETRARLDTDAEPLFTVRRTLLARGEEASGGPRGSAPVLPAVPTREPDLTCSLQSRRAQALLYRLCGDRNPMHADPALAKRLGLPAPVLHALCTFGIACRAVLKTICEYDHTLIREFGARFTAPVYPGETLVTEMWQEANVVSYRVRAEERDTVVLDHGRCVLTT